MSTTLESPQSDVKLPSPQRKKVSFDPVAAGLLLIAAALLVYLASPVVKTWFSTYFQTDTDYAYGPLVPFIVALMIRQRREALAKAGLKPSAFGLIPTGIGLAVMMFALKEQFAAIASLSFLCAVYGIFWSLCGWAWVKAAWFPLAFLLWMAPLPGPIIHDSTYGDQQICTHLANRMLNLLTFPTSLSGNVITMSTFVLFVDVPCSGMKLLLTMMMFGSAFAWLTDGPVARRVLLFILTFPLSIAVNSFRIVVLGILGECFGGATEHMFHDSSGLMTDGLGLLLLFYMARKMGCRTFAGLPLF